MASPTPSASSPSALRAQLAAAQQAQRAWAAAGVRARLAVLQEIGRRLRARRAEVDAGLGADGLSRVLYPPQGFPLAVVTAALGAPVLGWLVLRRIDA